MPQESFDCALGIDPALRVTYERVLASQQDTPKSLFAEQKKVTTHAVRTFIINNHSYNIKDIAVRDALPIASPAAVKVILKKPQLLAELQGTDELDVDMGIKVRWYPKEEGGTGEADGKYEWLVSVDSGKGCTLETEWEVQMSTANIWDEVADLE